MPNIITILTSEFPALNEAVQKGLIKRWFLHQSLYVNPIDTPYSSREGGHYALGHEFFTTLDCLEQEFSEVDTDILKQVARDIEEESECDEWGYDRIGLKDLRDAEDFYEVERGLHCPDAFKELDENLKSMRSLLEMSHEDDSLLKQLHQMIFVSCVTYLEVYLSDTFISLLLGEPMKSYQGELKTKYVRLNKNLIDIKLGSCENCNSNINTFIKKKLSSVSFHNLKASKKLYKKVIGINFKNIDKLKSMVHKRHDFVHRGGKSIENKEISTERDEITKLISDIEIFCRSIEDQKKVIFGQFVDGQ